MRLPKLETRMITKGLCKAYVGTNGAVSLFSLAGGESSWWSSFSSMVFSAVLMRLLAIVTLFAFFISFFIRYQIKSCD